MSANSFRCVIADGDETARARLRSILSERCGVQVVVECADGVQAAEAMERTRPEVAFLEVDLPRLDSFSACGHLGGRRPLLVLLSARAEHAVRAYDLPAFDFILKPYGDYRLMGSVERLRAALASRAPTMPGDELRSMLRELRGRQLGHLAVRSRNSLVLIGIADIDWIEAAKPLVHIHAGRETHSVRMTMTDVEARLPKSVFMRVHREALVNLHRVRAVRSWLHNDFRLDLSDGTVVPLSRLLRKEFLERLKLERAILDTEERRAPSRFGDAPEMAPKRRESSA